MTVLRLFAILFITACTSVAWFILGTALNVRTSQSGMSTAQSVLGGWGPPITQVHPQAWYQSPGAGDGKALIRPSGSKIDISLGYEPRQKGLMWYRMFAAGFRGEYTFTNPTPIPQTIYVQFSLPSPEAGYNEFLFTLNGKSTTANVTGKEPITDAVVVEAGESATLVVGYKTRGLDRWTYSFGPESRVQNFALHMTTDFQDVDFPTGSPTDRKRASKGWDLSWAYPDEIGARPVSMEMPKVLNPGPVASRITFFSPVSLLFFFSVLVVICLIQKVDLHPMNFFFLAAGCFAFQLLFAYLVDVIPLGVAFAISSAVSLAMVSGYLLLAKGARFARFAAAAQFAYMVLFSYSFFFDGLTGLTITVGAIITLGILMVTTAKVNWSEKFTRRSVPPPLNTSA
ncbi:MAG: inner membrane CreD family protein [Verrucomicrobia bacterium]|nr:inner membrane CreD family protein [Verrucomicrobiota bacterium]